MVEPSENSGNLSDKFGDFKFSPNDDLWNNIQGKADAKFANGALSDKFSEFNHSVSPSAWNNIELALHPERNKRAIIWWWGAAASLLLLISMNGLLNFDQYHSGITLSHRYDHSSDEKEEQNQQETPLITHESTNIDEESSGFQTAVEPIHSSDQLPRNSSSLNTPNQWEKPSLVASSTVEIIPASPINPGINLDSFTIDIPGWNDYHINPPRSIELENNLAGNFAPSMAHTPQYDMLYEANSPSSFTATPGTGASPNSNSPLASYDLQVASMEEYRPPFAIGMNYGFTINKRWGIESGLNLSIMNSSKDYVNGNWKTQQNISRKYVGIPLQLTIKFLQKRRFNLYTNIGTQFEFGIKRSIKVTDFDHDVKVNSYTSNSKLGNQANAFAGIGFNYLLRENLGVYAQSTLSHYYFQSHANMWSQKSLWPGFQFGVRYNW